MKANLLLRFTCVLTCVSIAVADGDEKLARAAKNVKQIIGHRGSLADRPENTLASYRRGIEAGATAVECDLRTTKDGVLVSSHDADLFRTTKTKALIKDLTLAEIRRLDAGSWFDPKYKDERIPTFQEILALCKKVIDLVLDLKEEGDEYAERVAKDVRKYGDPKKIIVGVRSVQQARQFRKLLPEARQLALIPTPESLEAFAAEKVEMVRLWPKWLKDDTLVPRVRKLGLKLHLNGTLGKLDETRELLRHEPESIASDDPAQLVRTLKTLAENKAQSK
jgi:glycerophosphoryl diester phosphodiesterase